MIFHHFLGPYGEMFFHHVSFFKILFLPSLSQQFWPFAEERAMHIFIFLFAFGLLGIELR